MLKETETEKTKKLLSLVAFQLGEARAPAPLLRAMPMLHPWRRL